jgi:hypothetical protein
VASTTRKRLLVPEGASIGFTLDADQEATAFELAAFADDYGLEANVGKFGGAVVHVRFSFVDWLLTK